MRKLTSVFLLMSFSPFLFSQKQGQDLTDFIQKANQKKLVRECTNQIMNGFLDNANKISDKLLSINANSNNYNFRKGYLYYLMGKEYDSTLTFLKKATGKVVKKFDNYTTKNVAPTDVYYFLGDTYMKLNQLDSAKYYLDLFTKESPKHNVLLPDAKMKLIQTVVAKERNDNADREIHITNLGATINSAYPDYSSVITNDNSTLFFTSRRPLAGDSTLKYIDASNGFYPEDVYKSNLSGSAWSTPEKLAFNSNRYNEAPIAVGQKDSIYVYSDSLGRGNIFIMDANDPKVLRNISDDSLNTKKYWETNIYLTKDGKRLYFSSYREGGLGNRDLYLSTKGNDGKWSAPKNLGNAVNTSSDEDAPFVSNDGKYLFYSSNNGQSMGGFDVFYAPINADGTVGQGKALPAPLNSTTDDIYYNSSADDFDGYISSNRNGGYGEKDIYKIENNYIGLEKKRFLIVALSTLDNSPMPETVKVKITCTNCDDNTPKEIYPRKSDNQVLSSLEPCKNYTVDYLIGEEEKVMKEETIKTDCDSAVQRIHRNYVIDVPNKRIVGEPEEDTTKQAQEQELASVKELFGYNKNRIIVTKDSYVDAIKKINDLLASNKDAEIRVEIYGSASTVPTKKYKTNDNLARLRANNAMASILKEFASKEEFLSRMEVKVVSAVVSGPEYEHDAKNVEKYMPYQYVEIKVIRKK